jgi:RsbT co-antagonist protein rsbRD N-terminal domain
VSRKPGTLAIEFRDLLSRRKKSILSKWFDAVLDMYPADTSHFLKSQKDRFMNPVGHTISQGLGDLLNELLEDAGSEKTSAFLDNIIKVKAIQGFSPSQAISFVFLLKRAIRDTLGKEVQEKSMYDELLTLESRIDSLALLAFDIYVQCREKIFEIRADEVKNRTFRLLEQAQLICGVQDDDTVPRDDNNGKE